MISYIKQQASDATASCWKCLHWGFIIYNFTFLWDAAQFDFQICMTSNISSLNSDLFGKHFLCGFKPTYILSIQIQMKNIWMFQRDFNVFTIIVFWPSETSPRQIFWLKIWSVNIYKWDFLFCWHIFSHTLHPFLKQEI